METPNGSLHLSKPPSTHLACARSALADFAGETNVRRSVLSEKGGEVVHDYDIGDVLRGIDVILRGTMRLLRNGIRCW